MPVIHRVRVVPHPWSSYSPPTKSEGNPPYEMCMGGGGGTGPTAVGSGKDTCATSCVH